MQESGEPSEDERIDLFAGGGSASFGLTEADGCSILSELTRLGVKVRRLSGASPDITLLAAFGAPKDGSSPPPFGTLRSPGHRPLSGHR
jgi:hypothetical protein